MRDDMPKHELDSTDRKILKILQDDAAISNVDLARKVALSASPCLRRVQQLEERGIIRRRVTLLEPAAMGLAERAFSFRLASKNRAIAPCARLKKLFLNAPRSWGAIS